MTPMQESVIAPLKRFLGRWRLRRRYDVINYFIRTRGYRDYLEIGVSTGKSMSRVRCAHRTGVDPEPRIDPDGFELHRMTSDAFFAANTARFDIVFVDGLHLAEQVFADTVHALGALREGGVVLVDDCNPRSERAQERDLELAQYGGWTGDVWRAVAHLRRGFPELFCAVLDVDMGVGVVAPRSPDRVPLLNPEVRAGLADFVQATSWADLARDRTQMLGLLSGRRALEREMMSAGVCRRRRART